MRTLEVRRHSKREQPAKHLSQQGVLLARDVGRRMGPFERVVCSSAWRCVETACAMGFAVDETRDDLHMRRAQDKLPDDVLGLSTFEAFADAASSGKAKRLAQDLAYIWCEIAAALSKNGRGLVVGHGAMTELAAVAALPDADHAAWGKALAVCEGIRLTFDRGRFHSAQILRVGKRHDRRLRT
ncbi:MAG TPA: hypothetical protein VH475_18790 [Tepidisphaeraceae bacterium]